MQIANSRIHPQTPPSARYGKAVPSPCYGNFLNQGPAFISTGTPPTSVLAAPYVREAVTLDRLRISGTLGWPSTPAGTAILVIYTVNPGAPQPVVAGPDTVNIIRGDGTNNGKWNHIWSIIMQPEYDPLTESARYNLDVEIELGLAIAPSAPSDPIGNVPWFYIAADGTPPTQSNLIFQPVFSAGASR